ncbi:MAG TPA: carbohydrate kinase family protein, partial [Candidatus Limnocylindria bacterium]|nr:carbohydrate kinase family protein [Candidatus Limnocylindria bacterium]
LVGNDEPGDWLEGLLRNAEVETCRLKRHPALGTSFTDVMSQHGLERTFFTYSGANAALGPENVPLDALRPGILHAGYILLLDAMDAPDAEYGTALARVLAGARERGIWTSVDAVSEQGERHKTKVPPALRHADFCVLNETEAEKTTGVPLRDAGGRLLWGNMEDACGALRAMGVHRWAVVHAPEGAFAVDGQGRFRRKPSLRLPPDAIAGKTGAGDAFAAGVLLGALREYDLEDALALGCCASAARILRPGRGGGLRPVKELEGLEREYGWRAPEGEAV